jgi:hypothetical protein
VSFHIVDELLALDMAAVAVSLSPRANPDMLAERQRTAPYLEAEPDKTLAFIAEMDLGARRKEMGRSPTPARCTPRSSARSPATAPSAG